MSAPSSSALQGGVDESEEQDDHVGDLPASSSQHSLNAVNARSQMSAAQKRDHSRKHSRVHSRNLSVFFPQPGSEAEREADAIRAYDTMMRRPRIELDTQYIEGEGDREAQSASQSLLSNDKASPLSANSSESGLSPSKSRKGHHRRHSVLHTYGEQAQGDLRSPVDQDGGKSFQSHIHPHPNGGPAGGRSPSAPINVAVAAIGVGEFIMGSHLWWSGQMGDSLATTGMGYLLIFDAFSLLSGALAPLILRSQSMPALDPVYRRLRIETILHFTQTIFLLFAAIYVCKESVEHALLEGSADDHEQDDIGLRLPLMALLLSAISASFSNFVLQNNAQLVAACNFSSAASDTSRQRVNLRSRHERRASILADPSVIAGPFLNLLTNPFSVTILFFDYTLALCAMTLHPVQVAALDKVLAGLQSAAMLYIAFPASKALGKVLLQTAPPLHDVQSVQLMRSIRTIQDHPLITYIAPPKLWQLTPPTLQSHSTAVSASAPPLMATRQGSKATSKSATLVAAVEIFVADRATDADILDITRWAWQLLSPSVGAAAGLPVGESIRGTLMAGEMTVQVLRESDRSRFGQQINARKGEDHSHQHGHHHHHHHR